MSDLTQILDRVQQGDPNAPEELLPLVYGELRKLAAARMAQEAPGQTLQATALVHEAWLRLAKGGEENWNSRGHFFGAAAEAMRRILVENARRKKSAKHGGDRQRIDLAEAEVATISTPEEMLLLDEALSNFAREDPAAAELAKLRLYAGLSVEDAAEVLGLSRATAFRHWTYARAWLHARLREPDDRQES